MSEQQAHMTRAFACIILAGGQGRRLGHPDKALVPLAGKPLITHVIERLEHASVALCVNARGGADRYRRALARPDLAVLPDPIDGGLGPAVGVLAGLEWAQGLSSVVEATSVTHLLTAPCDVPFVPYEICQAMKAGAASALDQGRPVFVRTPTGPHPTIALWPIELASALRRQIVKEHRRRMQDILSELGAEPVDIPEAGEIDPFFNVNTPGDLAQAEAHLREAR